MRSSRFINDIKDNRVVTELLRHRRVYLFEYFFRRRHHGGL